MTPLYPANSINTQTAMTTVPTILNDLPFISGGMEAARNYATRPSSRVAVFDKDDDVFYVISTDVSNNKTNIERKRFFDEPEPRPEDKFVSKEEFSELRGEITNVQQSLQQLIGQLSANTSTTTIAESGSDEASDEYVSEAKGKHKSASVINRNSGR